MLLVSTACDPACAPQRRQRETILKSQLVSFREAIKYFHKDKKRHPESLEELVADRYIYRIPIDPLTQKRDTWVELRNAKDGVRNVRSGAPGYSCDNTAYRAW